MPHTVICGSLADEQWILDFMWKLMPLNGRVYRINQWLKQKRNLQRKTSIMFVLLSPNLLKCSSILEHIKSVKEQCRVVAIKITREEIPSTHEYLPTMVHDATIMNEKILANLIFPPDY